MRNATPWATRQGDENLYRYVGNRPTDGTDPIGLSDWIKWLGKAPVFKAGEKELQQSVSGSALLRKIEKVAEETSVQVRVYDVVQLAIDSMNLGVWKKMSKEAQIEFIYGHSKDNSVNGNIKKGKNCSFLVVRINPRYYTVGDTLQSWCATGPRYFQVRLLDRPSEGLYHELTHTLHSLQHKDAIRPPTKEELGGVADSEWVNRWDNIQEYLVMHEMKPYYDEFHLPVPWAHRSTDAQNQYVNTVLKPKLA